MTAYALYAAFAIGAFALYMLFPRVERTRALTTAGWLAAAAAGLIALMASQFVGTSTAVLFSLLAAAALLAAIRVVTHPKPVYSAVYFIVVVVSVAAILLTMQAEFLAVALVIVYAGAIMVTYLFVIMLAQQPGAPVYDRRAREPLMAVVAGFLLTGAIAGQVASARTLPAREPPAARTAASREAPTAPAPGNTSAIGVALMVRYPVALEVSGILLLISMVGAVALSRKRVPSEVIAGPAVPLGQIGKEVEPF